MTKFNSKTILKMGGLVTPLMAIALQPAQARESNVDIVPYLEVQQVLVADLKDGTDVLTYTTVAAGLDTSVQTRRAQASVNLRYERRFFYSDGLDDEDVISGIARANVQLVPDVLAIEGGALATRTRVDVRGQAPSNQVGVTDNVTQVYSGYIGPALSTNIGALDINANYRAGYTKVEAKNAVALPPGQQQSDVFDDSVSHSASTSIGMAPGELPFGWTIAGGWEREDAGQLDNRYEGRYARADVVVPVSPKLALVGGVGYEDIELSERDALRDVNGDVVVGADGRLVTDKDSARTLSYDQDGIIWDAGVMWRPSRRTSLEARIGQRYGSETYSGNFGYQPNRNTSLNVSVYDTVSGFGNMLNDNLALLGTDFNSNRNPLSGELNGCAFGASSSLCLNDALQSAASSSFRARGVNGQLAYNWSGWNTTVGLGYSRRQFFASQLGAIPEVDGLVDENYYTNLSIGKEIDARSGFDANVYANFLNSGVQGAPSVLSLGTNAAYYRQIVPGLQATAAAGLDSYRQNGFDSELTASALLGLKYEF